MKTFNYRNQEIQVDYYIVKVKGELDSIIISSVFHQGTDITMVMSQSQEQEILEIIENQK